MPRLGGAFDYSTSDIKLDSQFAIRNHRSVKGGDDASIDREALDVVRILNATPGVIEVTQRSRDEAADLLTPWLGEDNAAAFLVIPAIIEVKVDRNLRSNINSLKELLQDGAPNATIDDHGAWHGRLTSAARSGQALAFAIFLLVMGAACAISIFAARAGLAANHDVVSLLHLVGATDAFIAHEVQRRFFALGLRGALLGLVIAFVALFLAAFTSRAHSQASSFLPAFEFDGFLAIWLLTVPIMTCLVTAYTARITVMNTLKNTY